MVDDGRSRDFVVRFAVGVPDGARSSVWRVWKNRNTDDIYIAPRDIAGDLKCSLHQSGICQWAVTSQHHAKRGGDAANGKRTISGWDRKSGPSDGFASALQLLFPTEFLSIGLTQIERDTQILPDPGSGKSILIDMLFTRIPMEQMVPAANQTVLGQVALSNGEHFVLLAGVVDDFDAATFRRTFTPLHERTEAKFLTNRPDLSPDEKRGVIGLGPQDGMLRLVEIGGAFAERTPPSA